MIPKLAILGVAVVTRSLLLGACGGGGTSASSTPTEASGLQQAHIEVVKQVAPSVVQVRDFV